MSKPGAHPKGGRPPKLKGPKLPYDEVDRLLVEGDVTVEPDGTETRTWPTQREVARRFGVSPGLIGTFAKRHRIEERKAAFQAGKADPAAASAEDGSAESPRAEAEPEPPRRKPGRPRKAEAPIIPLEELDRVLVFGEVKELEGGATTTVYPSYRQVAERYGVAPSYVASYVKSHNCLRRREEAKTRLALRVEDKLLEKRAEAIAVAQADVVRMIDEFLLSFEKALKEGRVRSDNPTDVNTFVRLKEFILGGADSRQELHAALSLESIQQRYERMLRDHRDAPELTGVVEDLPARAEVSAVVESNDAAAVPIHGERSRDFQAVPPPPAIEARGENQHDFAELPPDEEDSP